MTSLKLSPGRLSLLRRVQLFSVTRMCVSALRAILLCYISITLIVWAERTLVNQVNHLQFCNTVTIGNFMAIVNVT